MNGDERLRRMEAWLSNLYKDAEEEMRGKWDGYMARQEKRSEKLLRAVSDAKTPEEKQAAEAKYQAHLKSVTSGSEYYRDMVKELARGFSEANVRALEYINGKRAEFFADGYNFSAGEINKAAVLQDIGIRFNLVDADTIEWLAERSTDYPDRVIMPPPDRLKVPEDERWSARLINAQVAQGIVQGESIPKIARRLEKVTDSERGACIRRARTMVTNAENAGRTQAAQRAEEWGVHTRKKWVCTHDLRTRDTHLALDGETINNDAIFWNGCRWPGDHLGPPQEVWNCRCTLITVVDGFSSTLPKGKEGAIQVSFGDELPEQGGVAASVGWDRVRALRSAKPAADMSSAELKEIGRAFYESEEYKPVGEALARTLARLKELQDEYDALYKESESIDVDALSDKEARARAAERLDEIVARRRGIYKEMRTLRNSADHKEAVSRLIAEARGEERGSLTVEEYKAHFGRKTDVRDVVADAYGRYPSSWVQASIDKSALHVKKVGRGYYDDHLNELMISGDGDDARNTAVHEVGHRMESTIRGILNAEKQFYEERTSGEETEWLGYGYGRTERTRRDDFVSEYMGKDYGGTAYELVAMGFEGVIGFTNRVDLSGDEDMRDWVTGILLAY